MRNYKLETKHKFQLVVYLIVLLAVFFTLIGKPNWINIVTQWGGSIIISIVLTGVAQMLLQTISGDILEKIPLTIEIFGIKCQISLFVIFTLMIKFFLLK